jgi:hypothetical protein
MKPIKWILCLILLFFTIVQSCKKNQGNAPDLPPESAFLADFSDFNSAKMFLDTTSSNWNHSVANVVVWSTIITVGLEIPVASYMEAIKNHDAVYQSDNTWLWEYSFGPDKNLYTAKLFGNVESDSVEWEMYITKLGDYEDFLWYSGSSGLDRMEGHWIVFNNPTLPTELLRIDWMRTNNESGHIRYMNIEPGGYENGGYIVYGNDADADLECYYHIYNKGLDNLIEIEWSKTDLTGRVKDLNKFSDQNWHCWDIYKKDVDCPI